MNDLVKNLLLWVVVAAVLLVVFQSFSPKLGPGKDVVYSEFVSDVEADRIKKVDIASNERSITFVRENGESGTTTAPVRDRDLINDLIEHKVEINQAPPDSGFSIWSLLLNFLPVLLIIGFWIYMMRQMQQGGGKGAMSFGRSRAKLLNEDQTKVTFADVAGCDEAKEDVSELVEFLRDPTRFQKLGGKIPRGVLMVGPPGTGKTLLAKAIAGEAKVPFFSISGSDFVEMFVGVGASRVRDLFEQAKANAPAIIFVDEIDAVGRHRGSGMGGGHDEREQTLNQLLTEMDGFDANAGVILMAATNRPEILDPALLRAGRFDRHVLVDRPDKKGREEILKVHIRNVKLGPGVDIEKIAGMTPGMVGADLANLVNEAALLAVRHEKQEVGMAEFVEAIERVVAGLEKKNRLINPQEREIVAYHELGHAIVALSLPGTDPVQKISIIPRGIAALGYTMQAPTEDRFLMKKTELLNRIATLLGGRASEETVFGDISTGAHNDLARATEIARSMVKEYGMSSEVGQVYFAREKRAAFLDTMAPEGGDYSEATAELIDREIRAIIDAQYGVAKSILAGRRAVLDQGAKLLLQREKIEGTELMAMMEGSAPPAA